MDAFDRKINVHIQLNMTANAAFIILTTLRVCLLRYPGRLLGAPARAHPNLVSQLEKHWMNVQAFCRMHPVHKYDEMCNWIAFFVVLRLGCTHSAQTILLSLYRMHHVRCIKQHVHFDVFSHSCSIGPMAHDLAFDWTAETRTNIYKKTRRKTNTYSWTYTLWLCSICERISAEPSVIRCGNICVRHECAQWITRKHGDNGNKSKRIKRNYTLAGRSRRHVLWW